MWNKKSKAITLMFSGLLLAILNYIINEDIEALPQMLRFIPYMSLAILGGVFTLSLCSLLASSIKVTDATISSLVRAVSEDRERVFIVGFFVTTYLRFIRPPLTDTLPFISYVEWIAVALTVCLMYTLTRKTEQETYLGSENPGWKKHVQEVSPETGSDMKSVTSFIEEFVDNGVKETLLVYLTLHLQRLGETDESILRILNSLIKYQENQRCKLHFPALPWTRSKLVLKSKQDRKEILEEILKKIDGL
jgi:hypothetical protein